LPSPSVSSTRRYLSDPRKTFDLHHIRADPYIYLSISHSLCHTVTLILSSSRRPNRPAPSKPTVRRKCTLARRPVRLLARQTSRHCLVQPRHAHFLDRSTHFVRSFFFRFLSSLLRSTVPYATHSTSLATSGDSLCAHVGRCARTLFF